MKKTILAIFLVGFLFSNSLKAQNEQGQMALGANAGFSIVGAIVKSAYSTYPDAKSNSLPALQITGDYALTDLFSIGAAFSYQNMGARINDYSYFDTDGNLATKDLDLSIGRTNVAIRALLHYGDMRDVDLYSGVRFGYTLWTSSHNLNDIAGDETVWDVSGAIAPQVILFGIRGYFTDNFGANAELTIGAPHFFSMGVSYRID